MIICDFCNKSVKEVEYMIAGDNHVHICGRCVLDSFNILYEKALEKTKKE